MCGLSDVTKNKGDFDLSAKEILIPLSEYKELITKKTVLEQIEHTVAKEKDDFGTIGILKAILQIDTPKKE